MAYVSVWANETFGIGPQAVATLFLVSGLVGAVGNPLIGLLSDRFGWRRRLDRRPARVTSLAYVGYTQVTTYDGALGARRLLGLRRHGAGAGDGQRPHPGAAARPSRRDALRILSAERTAWSIGIILGPAIAAAIVTAAGGTRPVFVAAALVQCLAAIMVGRRALRREPADARPRAPTSQHGPRPGRRGAALGALVAALVLVLLPAQTRTMYLPLFVTGVLREPAGMPSARSSR